MVLNGRQKAAMLLMSLDPATAAEVLKGVDSEVVQELAVEVAYMDASGLCDTQNSFEVTYQFCNQLKVKEGFQVKGFLSSMLKSTVGTEKALHIQTQIGNLLYKRDPFISIRSADSQKLAMVLEKEHPQAIAVVLSELTSKKSSEVLGLLSETVRSGAVTRMTASEPINIEAKMRIAQMVCQRLEEASAAAASGGGVVNQTQSLRKVAVMLRNLTKEIRDGLLSSIREKDSEMGQNVAELMILWEDLPLVADRSLQTALREVDSQQLAKALIKADDVFVKKIKANISERAAAAIEEETSLMSSPKKEDIESAREEIVNVLRGMNEKGELNFVEQ